MFHERRSDQTVDLEITLHAKKVTSRKKPAIASRFDRFFDQRRNVWEWSCRLGSPSDSTLGAPDILFSTEELLQEMISRCYSAASDWGILDEGRTAIITLHKMSRSYENSEGTFFIKKRELYRLILLTTSERLVSTHLTDNITSMLDSIQACAQVIGTPPEPIVCDFVGTTGYATIDLVLSPEVSAVLIHELVGHLTEELASSGNPICRIASPKLTVLSLSPDDNQYDDEGTKIRQINLVKEGLLCEPLMDRVTVNSCGGQASGMAQAAYHGGVPRLRCTHLAVQPGMDGADKFIRELRKGVFCTSTTGGLFSNGTAFLAIDSCHALLSGEISGRHVPILCIIDFRKVIGNFEAVGADLTLSKLGECLKAGERLPSRVIAPSILLKNVQVRHLTENGY